ncbi:MAG: hypothetical protein V7637_2431 [Mycobacteriales bacterium]
MAGVTDRVVRRLDQLVLAELEPGAELPSESELASQLAVSRLTVREAVRSLQARGLVETRRGRRPRVAYPNAAPVGDFFTSVIRRDPRQLLDLLEVRRALEVHIASLAAQHASRASVAALELALDAMRHPAGPPAPAPSDPSSAPSASTVDGEPDADALHAADLRFHQALAAASGNQLLDFLIEAMEAPLHASRLRSLRGHLARGGTVADVIEQHARILDRVVARDAAGAAAAMRDHLAQTARDLRVAFALEDPGAS